mmetsp:Transcript_7812/g.17939  ORF Transcript_7812/g.17939 Transcript_7812/m.17939 type:complete len:242 (+) Transcript_7812:2735-3460(+)
MAFTNSSSPRSRSCHCGTILLSRNSSSASTETRGSTLSILPPKSTTPSSPGARRSWSLRGRFNASSPLWPWPNAPCVCTGSRSIDARITWSLRSRFTSGGLPSSGLLACAPRHSRKRRCLPSTPSSAVAAACCCGCGPGWRRKTTRASMRPAFSSSKAVTALSSSRYLRRSRRAISSCAMSLTPSIAREERRWLMARSSSTAPTGVELWSAKYLSSISLASFPTSDGARSASFAVAASDRT